ncbi:mediator of RNA polymerase II transcription subunit 30 isoform X3 [Epargyreus clarus]|uniref:mediator of RNA polymerase II transcription subunit 30 isoform X3 n=1 Tax=Epargyreus clarus TaxID=520877 RepID=UPI003C2B611A
MAGQGHQFPGNFQGNAGGMRSGFGAGPMGNQMQAMPNQLTGVMGGPMGNTGMVGMGNQMVPPYGAAMQNQMGNMGMGGQGMGVGVGGGPGGGLGPQGVQQQGGMQTASAVQTTAAPPPAPAAPTQSKEFNTASLCKFGQETVQDIVSRTQDVFQTLKAIQPPNGTQHGENASNDKKAKMQEQLRTIRLLFKRLRLIYEKCNETCQGMEYTHMESLIPLRDEADNKTVDERRSTESYRLALEENQNYTEQVVLKNKHLKEVITRLRSIIWVINNMLTMRQS